MTAIFSFTSAVPLYPVDVSVTQVDRDLIAKSVIQACNMGTPRFFLKRDGLNFTSSMDVEIDLHSSVCEPQLPIAVRTANETRELWHVNSPDVCDDRRGLLGHERIASVFGFCYATKMIHREESERPYVALSTADTPLPSYLNFLTSMAAGVSGWLFVHPADTVKVRMQLKGAAGGAAAAEKNLLTVARNIVANEGVPGLYSGLSAAIARQCTYTTMRLGFFEELKGEVKRRQIRETLATRTATATLSGATASFLSCPVEVCLVRMQADGRLPVEQRRGYHNVFDALIRVAREEGVLTYWRGATPTVLRACVVSATQLGTYDQAKHTYKDLFGTHEGTPLHLASSLTAGFVYSVASLPLDTAKTRMQSQGGKAGELLYNSTAQTIMTIAREEGVLRLWKGFGAYFIRGGGHTVAMMLFHEKYKAMARAYVESR